MKIRCGLTRQERFVADQQWHRYFAWFPVRVGSCERLWLEWVARKGVVGPRGWHAPFLVWEYATTKDDLTEQGKK